MKNFLIKYNYYKDLNKCIYNKMYHLPEDIIRYIYEFDNTYKLIFDKVLHSRYEIYKNKKTNNYFIFDEFTGNSFVTNSLINPTWKTKHHTHKKSQDNNLHIDNFKKKMILLYELEKISEILQYNIHENLYDS
tara:strand:+ start:1342 stop:1740 length:399 start_codon:yes stop_codon:yes gene_type:complete